MKKIKIILILIILFTIFIFTCAYSYVSAISDNLYNSIFRLHVIANSDSEEDQNLKYIVRDNLINYINENCKDSLDELETITVVVSTKHNGGNITHNQFFPAILQIYNLLE